MSLKSRIAILEKKSGADNAYAKYWAQFFADEGEIEQDQVEAYAKELAASGFPRSHEEMVECLEREDREKGWKDSPTILQHSAN